nr:unnamed protein product [Digitaria exilis]
MTSPAPQQAPPAQAPPPPPPAPPPTAAPAPVPGAPVSVQPPLIQPKPPPPPPPQQQPQQAGPVSGPQPPTPAHLVNLGPQPPLYRGPICWNAYCKDPDPNSFGRRGWKVRSGPPFSVYADLCGRCYSQFEQGIYCETFHSEEGGWRNCETCGRRVHCGCIVSIHKYQLRDAGGVDCAKCARNTRTAMAYFPPISQPEGLPLKVQDASGKEWIFQFRFWPNNNSRMYVLEGVTPCIQSMQLQAGDTVTFSRIDPEGKLIMGFRKATNISSEQEQTTKPANGAPSPSEASGKVSAPDSSPNAAVSRQNKVNTETKSSSPVEPATASNKIEKDGLTQKEVPGTASSSPGPVKRKATNLNQKNKRLRIENDESMELKITWEEAQELLRPPPKAPSIVIIDGHEFEEYEEPPVLGRKTYFVTDQSGSSCEAAQEISTEGLAELIPIKSGLGGVKKPKTKTEGEAIDASDGLDTLANLAILGEGESLPSQQTTKHPRHRPGCSCIVCIQPPSGKGPKHKQTCTCNVCMTVRRRFRTLMLRREKRATTDRKKDTGSSLASTSASGAGSLKKEEKADRPESMAVDRKVTSSPVKNHIDLNSQPERDDEQSPKSGAAGALSRDNPT